MSLLPNKTHRTPTDALFAPIGVVSQISTLISEISSIGQANPNPSFSTITVNDSLIRLDGTNYISTIDGNLYFNEELIATSENLSSVSDWAIFPAVSSIDVAGFDINDADNIGCVTLVATTVDTTTLNSQQANTSSLVASTIQSVVTNTSSLTADTANILDLATSTLTGDIAIFETLEATNTILTDAIAGNNALFSTITASTINVTNLAFISTFAYVSTISSMQFEGDRADFDELIVSSINGEVFPQVIPPPFTLPNDIVCSTLYADTSISTATLNVSAFGGNVRMGGIPDTLNQITTFAESQTHGSASLGYTINAFGGGNFTLNASNDCLINVDDDFTVTAGDVNLTSTDPLSVMNLTATGVMTIGAGGAVSLIGGGAVTISAVGIATMGGSIGTSIEDIFIDNTEITGVSSIEMKAGIGISSLNGFQYVPTQSWATIPASQAINANSQNIENFNVAFGQTISTTQGIINQLEISSMVGGIAVFDSVNITSTLLADSVVTNDVIVSTITADDASISTLTVSTINGVPHANYVQNPLTSNLSAFNPDTAIFYNITDAGTISANDVRTNNIGIPAGSLATEISVDDSLLIENTKKISFVGDGLIDAGLGLPMKIEATHISTNAIHVSSILNKNLYSEVGVISSLTVSTLLGIDLGGGFTQSTIVNNVSYPDNQTYYDASYNIFANQAPYANEPPKRPLPVPYVGTIRTIANTTDLINAISAGTAGDRFLVTADFVLSSPQTIPYGVEFTSDTGSRTISFANSNQVALTFSGDNNFIHDVNVTHTGPGSIDSCLSFTSLTAINNYVNECILTTNEIAITSFNAEIQITNNDIRFIGSADNNRYISFYGALGTTIISNNSFAGNGAGTPNTQCIALLIKSGGSTADYNNARFVITDNTTTLQPVQRLFMAEANLTGTNSEFWFMRNSATVANGFVIFFSNPLAGISNIYASDNVETLAPGVTLNKGLIGLDVQTGPYVLPLNNANPVVRISNNTVAPLRADYNDWTTAQDRGIAYQNVRISATELKNYSIGFKGSFFLPDAVNSSITTQAVRTDFAKVSTLQVSTMAGFSPITFLSSIKMNNNDITGINTLSTTTVTVENLVVSSINGTSPSGGGGSIPPNLGVSSLTTSTITFGSNGGIVDLFNIKQTSGSNVFAFTPNVSRLKITNPVEPLVENNIQYNSLSIGDGTQTALLSRSNLQMFSLSGETNIFPLGISTPSLTLTNLSNATTSDVLYFDTATSRVSRGTAPTASVPTDVTVSSLQAVSTVAVSTFTSSMTSFFTSTNQFRANDVVVEGGILANGVIAGNNVTANGMFPAGIVSGRQLMIQDSITSVSSFTTIASISSLTVSSINGATPGGGGGGGFTAQTSRYFMSGTQNINTAVDTPNGRTPQQLQFNTVGYSNIPGLTYINGGTWSNSSGSNMTIQASANIWLQFAGNTAGTYGFDTFMSIGNTTNGDSQWFSIPNYGSTESINNINRITFHVDGTAILSNTQTIKVDVRSTYGNNGAGPGVMVLNQNGLTQMNILRLA